MNRELRRKQCLNLQLYSRYRRVAQLTVLEHANQEKSMKQSLNEIDEPDYSRVAWDILSRTILVRSKGRVGILGSKNSKGFTEICDNSPGG